MLMSEKNQKPQSQAAMTHPGESDPSILLAEDDDELRHIIANMLRSSGFYVTEVNNGADLLGHLHGYLQPESNHDAERYDLIISDIRMPGIFGSAVAEGGYTCDHFPPIILITAFADREAVASAKRNGVRALLSKPFDMEHLRDLARKVCAGESQVE